MMYLFDHVKELCAKLGIDTSLVTVEAQGIVYTQMTQEPGVSPAGTLVYRLEQRLGLVPERTSYGKFIPKLGERWAAVQQAALQRTPLGKGESLILFSGRYSPQICRVYHDYFWVFGDNCQRVGKGGQAIIRDEPNALGIATKRTPGGGDQFFRDGVVGDMGQVCEDLLKIDSLLKAGKKVILPITEDERISLGCGLANLPYTAPTIYAFIEKWFDKTCRTHRHGVM